MSQNEENTAIELDDKEERFCLEYVVDCNGSQAAARAGYAHKRLRQTAYDLLTKRYIQERISELKAEIAERAKVTAERILEEQARIAFADMADVLDFSHEAPRLKAANEISADARRTLSTMKVKRYTEGHGDDAREVEVIEFKQHPKQPALEMLADYTPMPPKAAIKIEHSTQPTKDLRPFCTLEEIEQLELISARAEQRMVAAESEAESAPVRPSDDADIPSERPSSDYLPSAGSSNGRHE